MRLLTAIGALVLVLDVGAAVAQAQGDALSRIVPNEARTVTLELDQVPVSEALEAQAQAGGVTIYFTRDVALDGASVNVSITHFGEGDLERIMRALLDGHNLRYRAGSGDTLLVSRS